MGFLIYEVTVYRPETFCFDQNWHRFTCDTTYRLDDISHPW
mgnify:CR=1 FL=1